ncbi:MAG: HIT family protein [Chloroflexaceae bacterium]|nr:HIT family protein [Chloroflexaceae bacterium]
MPSIFSRIVKGELPCASVYQDEQTMAFMDINPASKGHVLVICKAEYPRLLDVPSELLAAVAETTQKVARAIMQALQPEGFNVLQNDGAAAGQVVFHYHVHIIPRWTDDGVRPFGRPGSADPAELETIAAQIRAHL